jgi:hypothetical protein
MLNLLGKMVIEAGMPAALASVARGAIRLTSRPPREEGRR